MDNIEEFARIYGRATGARNIPVAETMQRLETEAFRRERFGPETQGIFYGRPDLWDAWLTRDAELWATFLGVPRADPASPAAQHDVGALLRQAQGLIAQALDKLS